MQQGKKVKKVYQKSPVPRGTAPINKKTRNAFPFALIPVILAIILYCNTIPNEYCLDDYCVVVDNTYVHAGLHDIPKILTTNFFNGLHNFNDGLYRPLPILTYAIEYSVIGLNPHVRHFINMLLYALAGLFIFLLAKRLLPGNSVLLPLSVACLYIAHPVHTEVVANISSKKVIALRMAKEVMGRSLECGSLDAALALERNAIQGLNFATWNLRTIRSANYPCWNKWNLTRM